MRAVIQRVSGANVVINGQKVSEISRGLLLLLGVTAGDTFDEANLLVNKTVNLRIFEDEAGLMNRSLLECGYELLVVPNFTLYADSRRGKRPSFDNAARPEIAEPLYADFICKAREMGIKVQTGVFGADMKVTLLNDGPVTIILDTDELKLPRKS